jgi:hypothetical protein
MERKKNEYTKKQRERENKRNEREERENEDSSNQKVMMKTFITCQIHRGKRSQSRPSLHQSLLLLDSQQTSKQKRHSGVIRSRSGSTVPHNILRTPRDLTNTPANEYFKIKEPDQIYIVLAPNSRDII